MKRPPRANAINIKTPDSSNTFTGSGMGSVASQNSMEPPAPEKEESEDWRANSPATDMPMIIGVSPLTRRATEKNSAACVHVRDACFPTVDHKAETVAMSSRTNAASHEPEGGRSVPVLES